MIDNVQRYTGNNHVVGPSFHLSLSNETLKIAYRDTVWFFEWHNYFGPSRVNGKTGEIMTKQPGEHSPFWKVVQWWKDQGCAVVDGVAQWKEPPIVAATCVKTGRKHQHYKGYERWAPLK